VHTGISVGWKVAFIVLITCVELFVDLGLFRLVTWIRVSRSPLHAAARDNQRERAKLLLASGKLDVDARVLDSSAVEIAAREGHSDMVDLLISYGASVDAYRESVWGDARLDTLGIAAEAGHLHIVQELVKRGVHVNDDDGRGSATLQAAITMRHYDVAEFLLKSGAVCGTSSRTGTSALHRAINQDSPDFVKLLLRYGADVNVKDRSGKTALEFNRSLHRRRWKTIGNLLQSR
jgi:ankyrin repeat protein